MHIPKGMQRKIIITTQRNSDWSYKISVVVQRHLQFLFNSVQLWLFA